MASCLDRSWQSTVSSILGHALTRYIICVSSNGTGGGDAEQQQGDTKWHFRSWFVAELTMVNMSVLFLLVFFWALNRNAHIRPTKGSKITHKPTSSRTMDDGTDESSSHDSSSDKKEFLADADSDVDADADDAAAASLPELKQQQRRRSKSKQRKRVSIYKSLRDYSTENDEDEDQDGSTYYNNGEFDLASIASDASQEFESSTTQIPTTPTTPSTPAANENVILSLERKSLLKVAKKIKVLSYLNEQAFQMCMDHVEYVTVAKGQFLFDRHSNQFDGSLYAVVSGKIRVRFHEFPASEDGDDEDDEEDAGQERVSGFSAGPGDVVTALLALLMGLVHHERQRTGDETMDDAMPSASGISAQAVGNFETTQVIRVPPQCFAAVLRQFPADVHRIAQTVLCRAQRVMVQILVTTLGLRKELLLIKPPPDTTTVETRSSHWERLQTTLATEHETSIDCLHEHPTLLNDAVAVVATHLGISTETELESMTLLQTYSTLISLDCGETLLESGSSHDACYLLLQGRMETGILVPTNRGRTSTRSSLNHPSSSSYSFHPHLTDAPLGTSLLGDFCCFSGEVSLFTVRCCHNQTKSSSSSTNNENAKCLLLKIPKHVYDHLIVKHHQAMVRSLDTFLKQISPVVHLLNWHSESMHVQAAEEIVQKGTRCDCMFVVLNGRLRASTRKGVSSQYSSLSMSTTSNVLDTNTNEEYGRGKMVGEVGCLTGANWPCDVYAIRNSEIAKVPMRTLLVIIKAFPAAGLHFARTIAAHVQSIHNETTTAATRHRISSTSIPRNNSKLGLPSYGLSLATIAVVPLMTDGIDISRFCSTLVTQLQEIAPSKLLTKGLVKQELGEKVYRHRNAMHDLKMTRLLADMEENNRLVVYQADSKYTWWTRLCIQQADCILLVVHADKAPDRKRVEQSLAWAFESMEVRIDLVVVGQSNPLISEEDDEDDYYYKDDEEEEVTVSDQLNNWSEQRKWIAGHHLVRVPFGRHENDFRRMCRRVTGRSVGLVLGGGGARGMAHLGIIRALKEAGVTVDLVGGTSQGAFVGALYARQPDDMKALVDSCRDMASQMSSMKAKLFDLTLPMTSIFSGRRFNHGIRKSLGKLRIQDLVLNFFCVTVDLQKQSQVIHTKGILWKYVRASMSLTGYLPPVSENGSLLVDGGYLNALPADVMRYKMGARTVISVDVSQESEREYYEYGTHLSGWWLLWNSWNPFAETVKVPSMGDISDMLIWVSSEQHRKNVKLASDLHLTPPIQNYGTLEYDKFEEIVEKSYHYAKPIIDDWVKQNPALVYRPQPNATTSTKPVPHDSRSRSV
jgi:lysophospholipid hydrolase